MVKEAVGVLALQGAFQKHIDLLAGLGIEARAVRKSAELRDCSALIIPGGESSTMTKLVEAFNFHDEICRFAKKKPIMGTCAGLIMMANKVDDPRVKPFGLMDFRALRNSYGRQVHSFSTEVSLSFDSSRKFHAVFIRAPGIEDMAADIKLIAQLDGKAIAIAKGKHLAVSFHPELSDDTRIHQFWLDGCKS